MTDKEQQEIFNLWLKNHKALLFKIVRAYAFTSEDRDDLFQEISLQVWRSIPNFLKKSAVTTWLYRIALNTSLRWRSKEQKRISGEDSFDTHRSVLYEEPGTNDGRVTWLFNQIGRLNEIDRSLCLLLLDDFSYKEMADMIGITEANVAVKIHRIKKYLAEQSKKETLLS